jgi:hypothetical protein
MRTGSERRCLECRDGSHTLALSIRPEPSDIQVSVFLNATLGNKT